MHSTSDFIWKPSAERRERAHVTRLMKTLGARDRDELWRRSVADIDGFWDAVMKDLGIRWYRPYDRVRDGSGGIEWTKWFPGGETNLALNCVDRHAADRGDREAILWEGDDGAVRRLTYRELDEQVCRAANALKSLGVGRGDTVGILMPMVPEVVVQLFACFKIGAVAIPIFSGFGVEAIATRLRDSAAKVLFTSDVALRRGKSVPVKETADAATKDLPAVAKRIVFRRGEGKCPWDPGRDVWWDELMAVQKPGCPTERLAAESECLIIFTSGTTGKPKGAVHTHAGCLATVGKELRYAFNVDESSRFFWFTDIGWMMGPWEMIGVTLFGGALFLFEGAPDWPTPSRLWDLVDRHRLTHLGISPTAIRLLRKYGDEVVTKARLDTLELLGSTGEPWDPESYLWYFEKVGRGRCPVINISGGTEIIGCLLSPLPIDPLKPCSLGGPGLGVDVDVFDEGGRPVRDAVGHLVCKQAIPSMTKGFLGDRARYLQTYFSRWPGVWYHGDWARVDSDGQWFLHGRSDDTIKIAGKRVGPAEYEAALIAHPAVAEAAAIGVPDDLKGEACVCYVVLRPGESPSEPLRQALGGAVAQAMGKALLPREIRFTASLPKTRSAKILRGLIRKVYLGEAIGDTASVENPQALDDIRQAR